METIKPNARFIYEYQVVNEIDLAKSIAKIDKSISESTKLQLANHQIIIYFDQILESSDFYNSKIQVGREVLGHDTSILSLYECEDLEARKVKLIPLVLHSDWKEVFTTAKSLVYDVKSWRLLIEDDFSKSFVELPVR